MTKSKSAPAPSPRAARPKTSASGAGSPSQALFLSCAGRPRRPPAGRGATHLGTAALESFPLLGQLKERPEAYQAIRTLQRAAESRSLSAELLTAVRSDLSAAGAA